MDRVERTGLGIALVGHAALFVALTMGLNAPPELPKIIAPPVEVTLTSEVAAASASPAPPAPATPTPPAARITEPAPEPPAPTPAPPPSAAPPMRPRPLPPVEALPTPAAPRPKPAVKADKPKAETPKPKADSRPKPSPRAKTETAMARPMATEATERRRPGLSKSIVTGLSDTVAPATPKKTQLTSNAPTATQPASVPVAQMTGAQKASLTSLLYTQLKPHWRPPSGADAELLVTQLSVRLNRDGSLAADPEVVAQRGINDSNRAQARLHADRSIQAVRRAAPFSLPPQYYDGWKWLNPLTFDGRLSR